MVKEYYAKSVREEWRRLVKDAYHNLEFSTTMFFLNKYLPKKGLILDAGGGPGRYTIELAKIGYDVVLFDLVKENLEFAERKIKRLKLNVKSIVQGDIRNLSEFEDNSFDAVLCLGGPLSHIKGKKQRDQAISKLIRVAKPDSPIFISVFGRLGCLSFAPAYWPKEIEMTEHFRRFVERGEDNMWRGKYYAHFFTPEEIKKAFSRQDFKLIQLVGLEGFATPHRKAINKLAKNKNAWKNWLDMHFKLCTNPIAVGISSHILIIGKKI